MLKKTAIYLALLGTVGLAGCQTTMSQQTISEIHKEQSAGETAIASPVTLAKAGRVKFVRQAVMPATPIAVNPNAEWIKGVAVNLNLDRPTPLPAVIASLAAQGLNISSPFPLDSYTFSGRLTRVDGETALRAVTAAVGLDYVLDNERQLVTLRTMNARTWMINVGNRRAAFATSGAPQTASVTATQSSQGSQSSAAQGASSGTGSAMGAGATGAASGATSSSAMSSASVSVTGGGSTGVSTGDDFWNTISTELSNRLQVLVPAPRSALGQQTAAPMPGVPLQMNPGNPMTGMPSPALVPMMAAPMPGMMGAQQGQGSGDLFVRKTIGSFSLNPDTGAITVQAPSWILEDLNTYLEGVQEMYNALITFRGQLLLVKMSNADGEGFDVSAFIDFASKYGLIVSNNALGGLTVSTPANGSSLPSVSTTDAAGTLLGVRVAGAKSALQVFNAFLAQRGSVSVVQKPVISTTSGVPGIFQKKTTDYYNTVSQQTASAGTGSAAVGTTNTLVPYETGMELSVNPRLDIATGLVRAPLSFNQVVEVGTKPVQQTITVGNSAVPVVTKTPILTKQSASGEVLLRDGDLVIVGGQTETTSSSDASGLPDQAGAPMVGLLGTRRTSKVTATTYFALQVEIQKRK